MPIDPELRKTLTGMKALSMRQPHAEAVMRGLKTVEYRSGLTKVRGRILIYASRSRYAPDEEQGMMEDYGIDDVSCDELPRGALIGTVELYDCASGEWRLRSPERLATPVPPVNLPQPIWFSPF